MEEKSSKSWIDLEKGQDPSGNQKKVCPEFSEPL